MERATRQTLHPGSYIPILSIIFERAGYYGLRAVLVLYMIGETVKMTTEEALQLYGAFTFGVILTKVIGGILGDLLLNNHRSTFIGCAVQVLGTLLLAFGGSEIIDIALMVVAFGTGLYLPNLMARFGKMYLNRDRAMDSAFTMIYTAINIGAVGGMVLTGYILEKHGFKEAFLAAAGLFSVAGILSFIKAKVNSNVNHHTKKGSIEKRVITVVVALFLSGVFWLAYEFAGEALFQKEFIFKNLYDKDLPEFVRDHIETLVLAMFGVTLSIVWLRFNYKDIYKIVTGFALAAIAYRLMHSPIGVTGDSVTMYLVAVILLSLAEIHVAAIILAVLTRMTNPKYLAIVMGLTTVPYYFLLQEYIVDQDALQYGPYDSWKICATVVAILSIYLIITSQNKKTGDLEVVDSVDGDVIDS